MNLNRFTPQPRTEAEAQAEEINAAAGDFDAFATLADGDLVLALRCLHLKHEGLWDQL